MNTNETYFTKIEFGELQYDFGKVKEGDTVMHEFKIKNTGDVPPMIYKAKGSCDCVLALIYNKTHYTRSGRKYKSLF